MENNIRIWNITELECYTDELFKEIFLFLDNNCGTKLLDMNKSNYSILEKYVYDIAMFHLKRLQNSVNSENRENNISDNIVMKDNYFVEFWVKSKYQPSMLHVDCDEYLRKEQLEYNYPLLSSVTYLNDCNIPTIISNIDIDRYMYKEFVKDLKLFFSFPKKGKQITFDGKYYHGSANLADSFDIVKNEDRFIIAINLWDKKPNNVEYYNFNNNNNYNNFENDEQSSTMILNNKKILCLEEKELEENINLLIIPLDKDVMNYNLFENILYKRNENVFTEFASILKYNEKDDNHIIHNYKLFLDESIEQKKLESQLKTKYGNILEDMEELMNENKLIKYNNRFLQRFLHPKIYCPNVCSWIINECENYAKDNGGWTKKRHKNYPTTDLPVENVTSIASFVFESLKIITEKIRLSYGLNDDIKLDYMDLFIVKYKHDDQNFLEIHKDGSFLSFNILLSEISDFEGGGTYFDDGLIMKGEQGDLIIHTSKINHSGLPISKGTRYLLVGFLNINYNIHLVL
jgi:hypothetical protein